MSIMTGPTLCYANYTTNPIQTACPCKSSEQWTIALAIFFSDLSQYLRKNANTIRSHCFQHKKVNVWHWKYFPCLHCCKSTICHTAHQIISGSKSKNFIYLHCGRSYVSRHWFGNELSVKGSESIGVKFISFPQCSLS